ncbi:hypothetical protein K450DRAFT_235890 [Umbelopsis ramanniana AG]|uniref:Uncharacterized protein n=1 Tax=Umbelopsis ramanniana AG TaxID=1314678 RepID=A0AAD5ECQ1_UMBRA|nr:uncharacterized protein K450DRAFT_235890 [Umbelopsis ramanniana AG]KAI8580774.1 hypothetical protein K450DRAFT_235890 [Umbelopsis ramanniana AG]
MPIVGHEVKSTPEGPDVVFTILTPEYDLTEQMSAKRALQLDPNMVFVYREVHSNDRPKQMIETDYGVISSDTERMITNYLDEGHTQATLEMINSSVASGRRPTIAIINMLINIIIDDNTINLTISKRTSLCRQSVKVLFLILECHGPRLFDPLWNSFRVSKSTQRSRNKLSNDEDDMQDECTLQQYEDFFDFVKSVFQQRDTSEGQDKQKQHGLLLDFLIKVLEADIQSRRESHEEMKKATIIRLLKANAFKSNLVRELDSIFSCYDTTLPYDYIPPTTLEYLRTDVYTLSTRILNMLVICAYTDGVLDTTSFEEETYRQFSRLHGRQCSFFLENISNPAFVSTLCGLAFSDSDLSMVPDEALSLKHNRSQVVKKIFDFDMMTRPISVNTIQDIWRHVMIMSKRISCYLECKTLRFGTVVISGLTEDEMCLIWETGSLAMTHWRDHISALLMLPQIAKHKALSSEQAERYRDYQSMIELTINMTQLCLDVV